MNNKRLFLYLTLGFIIAAIAGTQLHELGHYLVIKMLGYDPILEYGSVSLTKRSWEAITEMDYFWFTLGGPVQTILTGTIGLLLLLIYRKSFLSATHLSFRQWVIVYLTFFWSRQVLNFTMWIAEGLLKGEFSTRGDEIKLAWLNDLPLWCIITPAAIIGLFILLVVIFRFVPLRQRLPFIAAGIVGSAAGFILWFYLLGPALLPDN